MEDKIELLDSKQISLLLNLTLVMKSKHKDLRLGQCLMSTLYDVNPILYTYITGTELDPFYNNDRIPEFLTNIADSPVGLMEGYTKLKFS